MLLQLVAPGLGFDMLVHSIARLLHTGMSAWLPRFVSEYQKNSLTSAAQRPKLPKFRNSGRQGAFAMSGFQNTETAVASLQQLGEIVRNRRKNSGLRIDDAAALSGVSVDLLSRLENGKSGVSTDRLLKVLDALGLALALVDKTSKTAQQP
jgi:ribosome-binding protein aMBF1 (putative translation factor)